MYNSYCVPGQHRDLYSTPNKNVIIMIVIIIIILIINDNLYSALSKSCKALYDEGKKVKNTN